MSQVSKPASEGSSRKARAPVQPRHSRRQLKGKPGILRETEITVQFLRLVNESTGTRDLIRAVTTFFQQQSGCDAVGVRLREGEDYPYFEARGFSAEFVLAENQLCCRDATGEVMRDDSGNPVLACMCGNVICGRFDPSKPFFTAHGSFWTNCTTQLLATTTEADRQSRTRNRCNGEGYESVALIPLRLGSQRIGLLQLNDRRPGRFWPELISLWERLADQLAIALAKFRADEALRESEARFRSLFENMQEGFAYCRMVFEQGQPRDFIYLHVNDAFERLTGLKNVVGRRVTEVIPGIRDTDAELFEIYGRVATTGQPEKFERYVQALKMWFSISVYCPAPEHFVAVFDVITARKEAEQTLREQGELLEAMSAMAHVGAWSIDVATGRGQWTDEVARIHELDPKLEPNVQMGLNFYHPESRPVIESAVRDATTLGKAYDLELELVTAKGNRKWVRTIGLPVKQGDRVVQVHGAIQDITDRKQAEAEVRRLNTELEQRVQDRTAQLEAANRELETFSYSVSHDLRAPLRAIDGFASILVEDHGSRLDAEGRRVAGVIRHEATRMGKLIDDLLAFSRATRGQMRAEAIEMTSLARAVFEECAARAPGRSIRLQLDTLLPAFGDPSLVRQVLANLLSNAIKYTKPRAEAEIELGSQVDGDRNAYWVKDNGVGFDPRYAGKLFGVFQRLHSDEQFEGTGVGLALVAQIVRRHGGRVWAEGKLNGGAVFHFTLPNGKERA
jgi:PAS domain S-box-containing protein